MTRIEPKNYRVKVRGLVVKPTEKFTTTQGFSVKAIGPDHAKCKARKAFRALHPVCVIMLAQIVVSLEDAIEVV